MKVYLARHGETDAPGRLLGATDPALSEAGLAQSRALAAALAETNVDRVISSALRRASQSAALVAARCGAPHEIDPRLDEIGYGDWDGLEWSQIERSDPDLAARKIADWWAVAPPNGETAEAFGARLTAFWTDLRKSEARAVVIVAHQAVNSCLVGLARSGHIDWAAALAFAQRHGESIEIDVIEIDVKS